MTWRVEAQPIPIAADPDGVMRIGGTRVTLETVIHAFDQGHTAEEIVSHYPVLRLADVYAVIAYYLNNEAVIQTYLEQQAKAAEEIWREIEAKSDYQAFRDRLLTRQQRPRQYRRESSSQK